MAGRREKYEKYASDIRQMFLLAGLWPGPVSSKFFHYMIVYYMLANLIMSAANVNFILHNLTNMGLVTKSMGIFISGFGSLLKVSLFLINRDEHTEMHEILATTFHRDFSNPELQSVLLSPLNYFYRSNMIMSRSFILIPFIYCIGPIISMTVQRIRGVTPVKYVLPFMTKYPWDPTSSSALYTFHYAFESVGGMGVGFISASTDAAFGFYVFQMASQFRTLSYRMNNLKSTDNYRAVIRECILRHQTLADCRDSLQRIYGPIVLWFMITSAISLCANVYQMTKMSSESIIVCVVYIIAKLLQTLFYAWFGMFLATESESFRDAVYNSGWPGSGEKSFMTNILIMLMWKPLVLTACNFTTISLDMFIAILNTALSYFFLLQTLEDSK